MVAVLKTNNMPYSKSNKEIQGSAFTMRSGNTTPFKQMGSSPLKQAIGGDAGEQITAWNKHVADKASKAKKYGMDAVNKEITRVAKGGKSQAELIKKAAKKSTKKVAKKSLWKRLGGKLFGTAAVYLGSASLSKADQPVVKTKKMSEKSMKSVQLDISKQMNPLKP